MIINDVMKSASVLGACMDLSGVNDWKRFVTLFFSPMGREFCAAHNFPDMEQFRKMGDEARNHGIYIDAGSVEITNQCQVGLIGDTTADLIINDNTKVHIIILMHGAKARIKASHYAVILPVNISGGGIEIEKDDTVKIL